MRENGEIVDKVEGDKKRDEQNLHYDFKNLKLKLDLSSSSYLKDSLSSSHISFL